MNALNTLILKVDSNFNIHVQIINEFIKRDYIFFACKLIPVYGIIFRNNRLKMI